MGVPLAMDELTKNVKRLNYARVLVDIDKHGNLYIQEVEYKHIPRICHHCNSTYENNLMVQLDKNTKSFRDKIVAANPTNTPSPQL